MRAVVQRVASAQVTVEGEVVGSIGPGLMVLVGIHIQDGATDVQYISDKVLNLRIFEDEEGRMNRSVVDVGGSVMLVSQFTLYGDVRKGRRPSFTDAAPPEAAHARYREVAAAVRAGGVPVETGRFGAHMVVSLENDGPVTLLLDSHRGF